MVTLNTPLTKYLMSFKSRYCAAQLRKIIAALLTLLQICREACLKPAGLNLIVQCFLMSGETGPRESISINSHKLKS